MTSVLNLIRPNLRGFNSYSSARDEAKKGQIWLNANESPYSLNSTDGFSLNRYPEKQPKKTLDQLAALYNVNPNQIVLSRGSDEGIDLLTRLFCRPDLDSIMTCSPTFGMYAICAQIQGANIIDVPLRKEAGFALDMDGIKSNWNPSVKIIFLCSPNNPTGNLLQPSEIFSLCEQYLGKSIIVVDEAYIEFSESKSLSEYINQFPNLVILRTFSKAFGLAGARCGVLLAQEEIVSWIMKIIPPYPVPAMIAQLIFEAISLRSADIDKQILSIKSEREKLIQLLQALPSVKKVWPSEGNFLLVETNDAAQFMNLCAQNGIVLRNMHDKLGLENCVRISIGLPEENTKLIEILNG